MSCSSRNSAVRGAYGPLRETATRNDEELLDIKSGETLTVDIRSGSVQVVATPEAPRVQASLSIHASTQEEARRLLAYFRLQLERRPDGLEIGLVGDEPVRVEVEGASYFIQPTVELHLSVPEGVRLSVRTGTGDISAIGPFAASELVTDFGNATLENVSGAVRLQSGSGVLRLSEVTPQEVPASGGKDASTVEVETRFGAVYLTDVTSSQVQAATGTGSVTAKDLQAEQIDLRSDLGPLKITDVTGSLTAHTGAGSILLTAGTGTWSLQSDFGAVTVAGGKGTLKTVSKGGRIKVDGYEGDVEARSSLGPVRVVGRFDRVVATTRSGTVHVTAWQGSAVSGPWLLQSGYGSVTLEAPADFACQLTAKTDFGAVRTEFPLGAVSEGGGASAEKQVQGVIGSGGERVDLRTASGDVRLLRLAGLSATSEGE